MKFWIVEAWILPGDHYNQRRRVLGLFKTFDIAIGSLEISYGSKMDVHPQTKDGSCHIVTAPNGNRFYVYLVPVSTFPEHL